MKITGYIIAIIGLAILATGLINEVRDFITTNLKINIAQIGEINLIITGAIIIAIGIFLVFKSQKYGKGKVAEVPIYRGNQIVGYRRH